MKSETKRWTHLGLSAALAGSALLAACGNNGETPKAEASAAPETTTAVEVETETVDAPMADPGAIADTGGEGEGGVAIDQARTNPVVFRTVFAITEAHILAARDAYLAGEHETAGEMYAHPVSEVLAEAEDVLHDAGVEDFTDMLLDASGASFENVPDEDIVSRTDAIVVKLREAAKKAPASDLDDAHIDAAVIADQIDRASYMYAFAGESDNYEPYLDGYGFYHAALALWEEDKATIIADMPETADAIEKILSLLSETYVTPLRPETLNQNPAQLAAASSAVLLTLSDE